MMKNIIDKGRFTQVEEIEELLGLVKKELNSSSFNLLRQGDLYRKPKSQKDKTAIIKKTLKAEKQKTFDDEYRNKRNQALEEIKVNPKQETKLTVVAEEKKLDNHIEVFPWNGKEYSIETTFINDKGLDLLKLSKKEGKLYEYIGIINLAHPFFENHKIIGNDYLRPFVVLFKGLLLSEAISGAQGTKNGGYIRDNLNLILKSI